MQILALIQYVVEGKFMVICGGWLGKEIQSVE